MLRCVKSLWPPSKGVNTVLCESKTVREMVSSHHHAAAAERACKTMLEGREKFYIKPLYSCLTCKNCI